MSIEDTRRIELTFNIGLKGPEQRTAEVIADMKRATNLLQKYFEEGFVLADSPHPSNRGNDGSLVFDLRWAGEPNLAEKEIDDAPSTSIVALEFSVRTFNCLKLAGIETVSDLIQKSEEELLMTKNFGRKSLDEIIEILGQRGLSLRKP